MVNPIRKENSNYGAKIRKQKLLESPKTNLH